MEAGFALIGLFVVVSAFAGTCIIFAIALRNHFKGLR